MKKISKTMAFLASSSVLLLAACGETTDNTVETDPADSSPVEDNQSVTPTDYGFTSFDLSIDTPDERDAIDVDYETGRSGTEIEYQNVLEDVNLGGDEAGTALESIFTNLDLTADMAKEDVLSTVTEAFGVTEYKEFELEVEFEDGKEVKWEDKK